MRLQAEVFRCPKRASHLVDRPFGACRRVAAHFRRRKAIEGGIIGRMDRDELALEMGGELGDLQSVLCRDAIDLVAIGL